MLTPCRAIMAGCCVPELAARGLDGWVKNWVQTPRITEETVLPSFRQGAGGYLWPRWR